MMRIAIAGTCRLAYWIAYYVNEETSHQLLLLSRTEQPTYEDLGCQVEIVDYDDQGSVQHALMGVDTVISTVTGAAQLALISAAVQNRVRRFVPAEFEGPPGSRPANDFAGLDRGKASAQQYLAWYREQGYAIETTNFVCGIFYERFAQGGLLGSDLGKSSGHGVANEGDFMLDIRNMTAAQAPIYNANNEFSTICLTSVHDVARFVVKAIDMDSWPAELTICGTRTTVYELISRIQRIRGKYLRPEMISWHTPQTLRHIIHSSANPTDQLRNHTLLAVAEGRYDFQRKNMNRLFPEVQPISFDTWLAQQWNGAP